MARTKSAKANPLCTKEQINEEIRKKAQELFEKSGRVPGRDLDNWLEAERLVECGKKRIREVIEGEKLRNCCG